MSPRPLGPGECRCFEAQPGPRRWAELCLHDEPQDTDCDAWKRLLELVEQAADDGREEFDPLPEIGDDYHRIVTLPPTISRLKAVRRLVLYGSNLVRIPPQIGEMTSLERSEERRVGKE